MAFREVAMFEVKKVIRLFGEGMPKKAIARVVGVDPKTVRSYVAAAERLGLAGLLDDEGLARLLGELRIDIVERPHREAWRRCEEHRDDIKKWVHPRPIAPSPAATLTPQRWDRRARLDARGVRGARRQASG
jgi:hypothetical protein